MLWVKMLHLFGVLSWMAAVFYLPRLLVNLAEAHAAGEPTGRLEGMAMRLFRFGFGLAIFAFGFGFLLWWIEGYTGDWIYWKLGFVTAMAAYYLVCGHYVYRMRRGLYDRSGLFFRVFNEISVLMVVPLLIFAVVKIG